MEEEIDFNIMTNFDPKIMNMLPRSLEGLSTWNMDEGMQVGMTHSLQPFISSDLGIMRPEKKAGLLSF